jgi:thiol-disulfide isomerase/thioredoxin
MMLACAMLLPSCMSQPTDPQATPSLGDRTLEWSDALGVRHRPLDDTKDHAATVFFFIAPECPISNGYAPEIGRIVDAFSPRGVAFYAVHPDPSVSAEAASRHALEFGYRFPVLLDPTRTLTQKVGATMTPEAAVLDRSGNLLYLGRVDDLFYDYGKRRHAATTHEVRDAIDAVLEGRPVAQKTVLPIGCEIAPIR